MSRYEPYDPTIEDQHFYTLESIQEPTESEDLESPAMARGEGVNPDDLWELRRRLDWLSAVHTALLVQHAEALMQLEVHRNKRRRQEKARRERTRREVRDG